MDIYEELKIETAEIIKKIKKRDIQYKDIYRRCWEWYGNYSAVGDTYKNMYANNNKKIIDTLLEKMECVAEKKLEIYKLLYEEKYWEAIIKTFHIFFDELDGLFISKQFVANQEIKGLYASGVNLKDFSGHQVRFVDCDFSNCNFAISYFKDCIFENCNLKKTYFGPEEWENSHEVDVTTISCFTNVIFSNCNLSNSDFTFADFKNVQFEESNNIRDAIFPSGEMPKRYQNGRDWTDY